MWHVILSLKVLCVSDPNKKHFWRHHRPLPKFREWLSSARHTSVTSFTTDTQVLWMAWVTFGNLLPLHSRPPTDHKLCNFNPEDPRPLNPTSFVGSTGVGVESNFGCQWTGPPATASSPHSAGTQVPWMACFAFGTGAYRQSLVSFHSRLNSWFTEHGSKT